MNVPQKEVCHLILFIYLKKKSCVKWSHLSFISHPMCIITDEVKHKWRSTELRHDCKGIVT